MAGFLYQSRELLIFVLLDGVQNILDMVFDFDLVPNVNDCSIRVDQETCPFNAHECFAVHAFFFPNAVIFANMILFIR